jgi:hypothetical protein
MAGSALVFFAAYHFTFRKSILENALGRFSWKMASIAFIFTLVAIGFSVPHFFEVFPNALYRLQTSVGIPETYQTALSRIIVYLLYATTAPVLFVYLYVYLIRLATFMAGIYKTSDRTDKIFFVAVMLVAIVSVTIVYNETNCFYKSVYLGQLINADVVYTFDPTAYHQYYYYYCGFLHRALLHIFFLPFAITAYLGSKLLFFVPNIYSILLCLLQMALLGIVALLFSRMLKLSGSEKFFFLVLYVVSYSVMLASITLDGYIASTFWCACFLYLFFFMKQKENCDFAYIAATGNLVVAGIFVLFYVRLSNLKDSIAPIIRLLFAFIVFLLLFNVDFFEDLFDSAAYYSKFSGVNLPLHDRLLQFFNFISSCFVRPDTIVDKPFMKGVGDWMNYQLAPVKSMSMLGLALLALAITGFVLNYREKFAKICLFWMALSFLILCLVGWGTAENGLILYSLYFGWAYFCLIFLAVEKLFAAWPLGRNAVFSLAIAALAYVNIPGIIDLVQFGIRYYPVN